MRWIIGDLLRFCWIRIVAIFLGDFGGKWIQTAALGLAVYYAGLLGSGKILHLPILNIDVTARENITVLACVSGAVALGFSFGVYLQFKARIFGLDIRRGYTEVCTARALDQISSGKLGNNNKSNLPSLIHLRRLDTFYCGRIASLLVLTGPSIAVLIVSVIGLLWIELYLTLVVFLFSSFGFVLLYRVNIQAASRSVKSDRLAKKAGQSLYKDVESRLSGDSTSDTDSMQHMSKWLDQYIGRMRAVDEGGVVVGITGAILLGIVIVGLTLDTMTGGIEWGRIVVYIVMLRVAVIEARGLSRRVTSINRFYPQAKSYWEAITKGTLASSENFGDDDLEFSEM